MHLAVTESANSRQIRVSVVLLIIIDVVDVELFVIVRTLDVADETLVAVANSYSFLQRLRESDVSRLPLPMNIPTVPAAGHADCMLFVGAFTRAACCRLLGYTDRYIELHFADRAIDLRPVPAGMRLTNLIPIALLRAIL